MKNLVFLISQPRSGSTLLQAIVGSHPEVHTCSEPWIALPFMYALKKKGVEFDFNGCWARDAIDNFFKEGKIDDSFYQSALNTFLSTLYQKALDVSGKDVFLDKTPRYYEIVSDLIKVFPEAKFIVLYRHPLAILNSILNTWVKDDIDNLFYFSRDLFVAPRKLIDFVSENHEKVCLVKYEDLVSSPAIEVERICEYIGVKYFEEISNYKAESGWAFGDKKFLDQKSPSINSLESWKNELENKRHANFCSYYLEELGEGVFNALGYDYLADSSLVNNFRPNKDDLMEWNTLLRAYHVPFIEEQKTKAVEKIKSKHNKGIFKKLIK